MTARRHWFHCSQTFHGERWIAARVPPRHMSQREPPTPRLCVCKTVAACFAAVLMEKRQPVFVYRTEQPRRGVMPKGVWDEPCTGERWLIPPVAMLLDDIIPIETVERINCAVRLYHHATRKNSDLWLRIAQYAVAAKYLDVSDRERAVVERYRKAAGIECDPEEWILNKALSALGR